MYFAVSYTSLFDNEVLIEFIEADTAVEAALERLSGLEWEYTASDFEDLKAVIGFAFDSDALINAVPVPVAVAEAVVAAAEEGEEVADVEFE